MSAVRGFSPSPAHFATHGYAATKAAVIGVTKSIASYYAKDGNLLANGEDQGTAEELPPGAEVLLVYDAGEATLRFLRGERLLGQLEGVVPNPKIVVSMGSAENGAEFV